MITFQDRYDAGQQLARRLMTYANRSDVIVLALPRGGVPVAFEVAQALHVPMDVFLVRKLGVPGYEELAMGAITTGGVRVLNDDVVRSFRITEDVIQSVVRREQEELNRRERQYRGDRPEPDVRGKTVILVDDGLATGASMRAAVKALRERHPKRIVVAVPTGAAETCAELGESADEVQCSIMPEPFFSVGTWYRNFLQTSDEEVTDLLHRAIEEPAGKET